MAQTGLPKVVLKLPKRIPNYMKPNQAWLTRGEDPEITALRVKE